MKTAIAVIATIAIVTGLIVITKVGKTNDTTGIDQADTTVTQSIKADKIEVVHFHGTQQCWSCITVGEFALRTIQNKFPDDYENGTIVFKDINGELPENQEIVNKFQARGSSLFINAIANDQDNIQEEIDVWRLVTNEDKFIDYFQSKLNGLLGR